MTSWRIPLIAIIMSLLLLLNNGGGGSAAPAPLAGAAALASLLGGGLDSNGTSPLALLVAAHLQHKVDSLQQFAELLALGANVTQSFFL